MPRFLKCLPLLLSAALLVSCGKSHKSLQKSSRSFFAMDTYMTITVYSDDPDSALSAAEQEISRLDSLWSVTDSGSDIFLANNSPSPVTVSDDTAELLRFGLEMSEVTGGAFDMTLYPVLREWGFTTGDHRVPTDEELSALLENVGFERVELEGNSLSLPEGMMIDAGAIGKGFAGDRACEKLREKGVTSAIIDLGGNVQAIGSKPDGSPWKVGIRSPFGDGTFGVLSVRDKAVITSGGYERFFTQDGRTYWHILDPATGYPADSGLLSVTVVGKEGRLCDALSTSIFVMGADKGAELWRTRDDFDFIAVTSGGSVILTEGLKDSFTLSEDISAEVSVILR